MSLQYLGESASFGPPQRVLGKSSTQPILFGVIGSFRGDQKTQTLQQKFQRPPNGSLPETMGGKAGAISDRHILGSPAKTHIPGLHHGQVPFAGPFMSGHGEIEVIKGHSYMAR
jgi:hypothetical protein